ncbi:MAG: hypothetical protein AAF907_04595, partial [Planctomycetota bacterium]
MNVRRFAPLLCGAMLFAGSSAAAPAFAQSKPAQAEPPDGVMSSEAFLKARPFWPEWERSGKVFKLEGRVRSVAGGTLRLEKIPLTVRPSAGSSLGRADNRTKRVEVTGRLASGPTGTYLQSTSVLALPSDDSVFTSRKLALDRDDPTALEGLAEWAESRAKFYDDPGMTRRAREARRAAFDLRWNLAGKATKRPAEAPAGVPADVWTQLALLDATPADENAGLTDADRIALMHRALRAWQRAIRDDAGADVAALAGQIRRRLPGAADLPAPNAADATPSELLARYDRSPSDTYAGASEANRKRLARRFFVLVERTRIEATAASDGRNGNRVAEELAARLPELPALSEEYRQREIAWRIGRIASSTRADAVALAELLNENGEPERAAEALQTWLAARERSLRTDGIGGLIRAAEEYRSLADDDEAAVRLLIEAYAAADPGSEEEKAVAARLRELGMRRVGGRWRTAEEAAAMPIDPIAAAVRDGRVVVGFSPAGRRAPPAPGRPSSPPRRGRRGRRRRSDRSASRRPPRRSAIVRRLAAFPVRAAG